MLSTSTLLIAGFLSLEPSPPRFALLEKTAALIPSRNGRYRMDRAGEDIAGEDIDIWQVADITDPGDSPLVLSAFLHRLLGAAPSAP